MTVADSTRWPRRGRWQGPGQCSQLADEAVEQGGQLGRGVAGEAAVGA